MKCGNDTCGRELCKDYGACKHGVKLYVMREAGYWKKIAELIIDRDHWKAMALEGIK